MGSRPGCPRPIRPLHFPVISASLVALSRQEAGGGASNPRRVLQGQSEVGAQPLHKPSIFNFSRHASDFVYSETLCCRGNNSFEHGLLTLQSLAQKLQFAKCGTGIFHTSASRQRSWQTPPRRREPLELCLRGALLIEPRHPLSLTGQSTKGQRRLECCPTPGCKHGVSGVSPSICLEPSSLTRLEAHPFIQPASLWIGPRSRRQRQLGFEECCRNPEKC